MSTKRVAQSANADVRERLRDVAAAAWGYRVAYEAYWGEDVPGSSLPPEQKQRMLGALVAWQQELDGALAAMDDAAGDFAEAKRAHRETIAKAIGASRSALTSSAEAEAALRAALDTFHPVAHNVALAHSKNWAHRNMFRLWLETRDVIEARVAALQAREAELRSALGNLPLWKLDDDEDADAVTAARAALASLWRSGS